MFKRYTQLYFCATACMSRWLMPILVFIMRFSMARTWWYSGIAKLDDWNQTVLLFQYEFKTPVLPYEVSAVLVTATELVTPFLLLFGIATRLATIPMLIMVAVIQLTYAQLMEHAYWAMLLCTILFYGPGCLSVDALIKRYLNKGSSCPHC